MCVGVSLIRGMRRGRLVTLPRVAWFLFFFFGSSLVVVSARQAESSGPGTRDLRHVIKHTIPIGIEEAKRHACKFDDFFACERGTTPADLVSKGIYANAAVALKGSAWRETSLTLLLNTIADDGKAATAVTSVSERLSGRWDEPTPRLSRAATMLRSLTMPSLSGNSSRSPPRYPSLARELQSTSSSNESVGVNVHPFEDVEAPIRSTSEIVDANEEQRIAELVSAHTAHLNATTAAASQASTTPTAAAMTTAAASQASSAVSPTEVDLVI